MAKTELSKKFVYEADLNISNVLNKVQQLRTNISKGNPNLDLLGLDKEIEKLDKLKKQIDKQTNLGFSSSSDVKSYTRALADVEKAYENISTAIDKISTDKTRAEMDKLRANVKSARDELNKLTNSFGEFLKTNAGLKNISKTGEIEKQLKNAAKAGVDYKEVQANINKEIDTTINKLKEQKAEQDQLAKSQLLSSVNSTSAKLAGTNINPASFKNDKGGAIPKNQIGDIRSLFVSIVAEESTAEAAVKKFIGQLQTLGIQVKNLDTVSGWFDKAFGQKKNTPELTEYANQMKQVEKIEKEITNEQKRQQELQSVMSSDEFQKQYNVVKNQAHALDEATDAQEGYNRSLHEINYSDLADDFKQYGIAAEQASTDVEELARQQTELDNTFNSLQNRLVQLLSIGTAYTEFRKIIRETYNDVKELDKAFGEIAMVTDYTVQDLWNQYGNYAKMANELGQATVSVIQASGLFYQQGLDTESALALTEDTMKLATLAGLDFADATSQMTAAIRAFKLEMTDGSHVTDVYAELAAHAAADVQGIATAMSKTASIANSAGMSFENTATFLTTMIEATQEAPDNIGTALKTVIAR